MHTIPAPFPGSNVRLHLLPDGKLGVSHTGIAHDQAPGGSPDPNAATPPDDISKLLAFLKERVEPNDLRQARFTGKPVTPSDRRLLDYRR
jgi:hypothetical protein